MLSSLKGSGVTQTELVTIVNKFLASKCCKKNFVAFLISGSSRFKAMPSFYFYGGVSLMVVVLFIIGYAVYFLRKNHHISKSESLPTTSTRYSFSLRPPPPTLPPPKAPAPICEQQQLILNSPSPNHYTNNLSCAPPPMTPDKKEQKYVAC